MFLNFEVAEMQLLATHPDCRLLQKMIFQVLKMLALLPCWSLHAATIQPSTVWLYPPTDKAVPITVKPAYFVAPQRRIEFRGNLAFGQRTASSLVTRLSSPVPRGFSLSGFPNVHFGSLSQGNEAYQLRCKSPRNNPGKMDQVFGDPVFFPKLLNADLRIKFSNFAPKTISYRIKRTLGIETPDWHYSFEGLNAQKFEKGELRVEPISGGLITLQKVTVPIRIADQPWLRYAINLPVEYEWEILLAARLDSAGTGPLLKRVQALPIVGRGKIVLIANLSELILKAGGEPNKARVREILIHIRVAKGLAKPASILLGAGELDFYRRETTDAGSALKIIYLGNFSESEGFDYLATVRSGSHDEPCGVDAVYHWKSLPESAVIPIPEARIQFASAFRENVPAVNASDPKLPELLNATDLWDFLDGKFVLQSKVVFQTRISHNKLKIAGIPHINGSLLFRLETEDPRSRCTCVLDAYGKEGNGGVTGRSYPVRTHSSVTLTGLHNLTGFQLSNLECSFAGKQPRLSSPVLRVKLLTFAKKSSLQSRVLRSYISLKPIARRFARTNDTRTFELGTSDQANPRNLIDFNIQMDSKTDSLLRYEVKKSANGRAEIFARVAYFDSKGYGEQLHPLNSVGEIIFLGKRFRKIELIAASSIPPSDSGEIISLENFEIRSADSWPIQIKDTPPPVELQTRMQFFDTQINAEFALRGEQIIQMPIRSSDLGEFDLEYFTDESMEISLDTAFVNASHHRHHLGGYDSARPTQAKNQDTIHVRIWLNFLKLGLILSLLMTVSRRVRAEVDEQFNRQLPFILGSVILSIFLMLSLIYPSEVLKVSWEPLMAVFFYAFLVRYKLRILLAAAFPKLAAMQSTPYFCLLAIAICIALIAGWRKSEALVEYLVALIYYLTLIIAMIEFNSALTRKNPARRRE